MEKLLKADGQALPYTQVLLQGQNITQLLCRYGCQFYTRYLPNAEHQGPGKKSIKGLTS